MQIVEVKVRYDNSDKVCKPLPCKFTIPIEVTKKIPKPVYVYYQLKGYYQNHRNYVSSLSVNQLQGEKLDDPKMCGSIETNEDGNYTTSYTGKPLNKSAYASPCGLIAKSFFNDEYRLFKNDNSGQTFKISADGIAWPEDKKHKFGKPANSEDT